MQPAQWQAEAVQRMALPTALDIAAIAYTLAFDQSTFQGSSFSEAGLACPDHIARSVRRRQAEYLAGRLCARVCLQAFDRADTVGTGPHREPLWPPGLMGSITHNRNRAAAVVVPAHACAGIGIDIETWFGAVEAEQLKASFVSDAELEVLQAHVGQHELAKLLTMVFSAKESFFKAAFPQCRAYFDFDAVTLTGIEPARERLDFAVQLPLAPALGRGLVFSVAFCALGNDAVLTACALPARATDVQAFGLAARTAVPATLTRAS